MTFDPAGFVTYIVFGLAVPLGFTASFITFVWGTFQYFMGGTQDEEAREKGKSLMLYGLLVLAGTGGAWMLFQFIVNAFTHGTA